MNAFIKRYLKIILISFFISIFPNYKTLGTDLSEIKILKDNINKDIKNRENYQSADEYLLDTGDELEISFDGLTIFNGKYTVDQHGNIILPEIKKYNVRNKNLAEVHSELVELYKQFIFNPIIDIQISSFRLVKVYISGEVKQPGLYTLVKEINQKKLILANETLKKNFSRLFNALKKSKGFTNYSDLSKVKIIRNNPKIKGGKIYTELNFLKLLLEGDQTVNIEIFDGDHIIVPKSKINIKEQILIVNRSNVSPEFIEIYITGNVITSGKLKVDQGSSLIQAIASSGGKKNYTGNIEFIRFNYDGSIARNVFRYDPNASVNTRKNPILMNGDIINVNKSILGNTTELLKEVTSPLFGIYGLIELLD